MWETPASSPYEWSWMREGRPRIFGGICTAGLSITLWSWPSSKQQTHNGSLGLHLYVACHGRACAILSEADFNVSLDRCRDPIYLDTFTGVDEWNCGMVRFLFTCGGIAIVRWFRLVFLSHMVDVWQLSGERGADSASKRVVKVRTFAQIWLQLRT
jgi:hypothetical protein